MAKLRKIFVVTVMSITVLSMSMLAAPFQVGAAATAGDLIKMDGLSSVYFLAGDGKRYVFPNETTYFSWYTGFSSVKTIPQAELESYPLGKNITIRPGTKLVKITTDPKVYAVQPGGSLIWLPSEAVATTLWGTNWAKRVVDVPDAFFTNYVVASGQLTAAAYPAGSLIKYAASPSVYYIASDGKAQKIVDEAAFTANRFNWDDIVTAPDSVAIPTAGADITGSIGTLTDTSSGAGGTPGAGTGLTITLSGTTAPSTTLIGSQSGANMASFNLTASNDGAVKVTTFKVKRSGISSDNTLSALYLYEGTTRLTDDASVSSGYITWNDSAGIIEVPAGQTKTITVVADVASIGTSKAGETIAVSVNAAADIKTNGASVAGSFPINGNLMSIADATLSTFQFGATTYPVSGSVLPGETDYVVWQNTTESITPRYVWLQNIRLKLIGSVAVTDIKDLRFYVDGIQKGDVQQIDSNGYAYFDFGAAPLKLDTGSRQLQVKATVIGGSGKSFKFSVQYPVDVKVLDSDYNVGIKAGATPATTGATSAITVDSGKLLVTRTTDSPSGNVIKDASGVALAKYEFKAYGENMKVEYLDVDFTSANDANIGKLRNGALFANGQQIGSTKDLTKAATGIVEFNLGSSLIVVPGTPTIVEVRADMYDNDSGGNDVSQGDKITITLVKKVQGVKRMATLDYEDVPKDGNKDGNQLTVTVGSMTLSKQTSYGEQSIAVPQTGFKLGSYVLSGNSNEAVNLNTVNVGFVPNGTFTADMVTNVYVKYGTKTTTIKSTVSSSASSSWSISEVLPKSGSMVFEVYGDIATGITPNDTMKTRMSINGITANSSQTANTSVPDGQTITVKAATLTVAKDGSSAVSAIVKANSTIDAAVYKFTAANDAITITEFVASTTGADGASAIAQATLKDGTTVIGTAPVTLSGSDYVMSFSGLNFLIPANTNKKLTVSLDLGNIGTGAGTTGANVQIGLKSYKYKPASGNETDGTSGIGVPASNMYAYKGIPTITTQTLPVSTLSSAGTYTLAKFNVSGDTEISWKKIVLSVATSSGITGIANVKLYDGSHNSIPLTTGTYSVAAKTITIVVASEETTGSKVYTVEADLTGSIAANDYINTRIAQPSSFVAPAAYSDAADVNGGGTGVSASFVWSDEALNGHSDITLDWNNDYLVKSLPTSQQNLSK